MNIEDRIYVAGHTGMVGSAIVRFLEKRGYCNVLVRTPEELDLREGSAVSNFFDSEKIDYVFLAAAKVGGIMANMSKPAEFLYDNLAIEINVIHQSYLHKVRSICFLGSSCIYPRECSQPMKEEYLLTGALEPTNEGYALAKIAGIKMIESYRRQYSLSGISVIPPNLYGTNDNYDLSSSHVLSSLVKKFVDAKNAGYKEVTVWGTGTAYREFMHVDDAAAGIIHMMNNCKNGEIVNIGWGKEISIRELAEMVKDLSGFRGNILWDSSKPDGMPRKRMDVSKMRELGFEPKISLAEGIASTIEEYKKLISKT